MQVSESLSQDKATLSQQNNRGFLDETISVREILFIMALVACITPYVSPPVALVLGIVTTQLLGHPLAQHNHTITQYLLQFSVIGLGFGMDAAVACTTGLQGAGLTVAAIAVALATGIAAGRLLGIGLKTSFLIAGGTAICGGSAIAALSPAVKARESQVAVALAVIFTLNAVALFIFPPIGHALGLSQQQFGTWAALAIHDTSAVLGAAGRYGAEALRIATTLKLARTLWIIPIALTATVVYRSGARAVRLPWFIVLFIAAMAIHTVLPMETITPYIVYLAHTALTLTLFFIGAGLSRKTLAGMGWRPLAQGIIVWIVVAGITLWMIV
jgi:uncharacterized integral membrane protein (TIGR00698 family)